ncbi:MAG TPA: citrate transporter [Clostridiales bacterium]|nr:citrate transporter [Clostridiales bacterium]
MSTVAMPIIMIVIIIIALLTKKVPVPFILAIVPILFAVILGFSINEISDFAIESINKTMKSVGYMLLFGLLYFTLLTETGMFDILVEKIMKLTGNKVNVFMVMIMTTVISAIGNLTASIVTAYLIVFPIMLPLYKRINFDRKHAMIIAQTAAVAMAFIPWGIGISTSAVFADVDSVELSRQVIPISICVIPVIIIQWLYFAHKHNTQNRQTENHNVGQESFDVRSNKNRRENLFWFNLLVFIVAVALLAIFKMPAYMVFLMTSLITILTNFYKPTLYRPIFEKSGKTFYNTLLMLVGISIFVGIFGSTGMLNELSDCIVTIFPQPLLRYMHLILLAICVIIIRFIPYQLYTALYPVLVSVGASFGLSPIVVIAPFVTNLAFGTGSSSLTPTTLVGTTLFEIDVDDYVKEAMKVQTVSNILVIIIGMLVGVLR